MGWEGAHRGGEAAVEAAERGGSGGERRGCGESCGTDGALGRRGCESGGCGCGGCCSAGGCSAGEGKQRSADGAVATARPRGGAVGCMTAGVHGRRRRRRPAKAAARKKGRGDRGGNGRGGTSGGGEALAAAGEALAAAGEGLAAALEGGVREVEARAMAEACSSTSMLRWSSARI